MNSINAFLKLLRKIRGATLIAFTLLPGADVLAQQLPSATPVVSYQGQLYEHGQPANGNYAITASIYSDPEGRTVVWTGNYEVPIQSGQFVLELGSGNYPLPGAGDMDKPLWVGVRIGESEEVRPLTKLTVAPFALNVANNSITRDKMATDYVASVSVNGRTLSSRGSHLNIVGGKGVKINYDEASESVVLKLDESQAGRGSKTLALTPFSDLTTATNTSATMDVGTGASLQPTGSGIVEANQFVTSASTTTAVDLGTSEVAGVLPVSKGGTGGTVGPWVLTGNAGTTAGTHFLGTTDDEPVEIHVDENGISTEGRRRVMRFEPNVTSANIIGGHNSNSITSSVGATISGGGKSTQANQINLTDWGFIGGGVFNRIDGANGGTRNNGVIVGGSSNLLEAAGGFIGGGSLHWIKPSATGSVAVGGSGHEITGSRAFIGGGNGNKALSDLSFVGGGETVTASGPHSVAVGGQTITASGGHSVVAGGQSNQATHSHSTVGGGNENKAIANQATVSGGESNEATALKAFVGGGSVNKATG